jgi:hypothetical protein
VSHLHRLKQYLQIRLPSVQLWRPDANGLASLGFIARHGHSNELRKRLQISMERDLRPLVVTPPEDLRLAKKYEALRASAHAEPQESVKAQAAFLEAYRTKVSAVLLEEADGQPAQVRIRAVLLTLMTDAFLQKSIPLLAELDRQSPGERSWTNPGTGIDLKPMLEMVRHIRSLLPSPPGRRRRRRR